MRKLFFLALIVAAFWSCDINDSLNDDFFFEILPIESATVPGEMLFGEVYTIDYSYFSPSTCHIFNDLYYMAEDNV